MTDEEIAEKLALLKQYSQEFDVSEALWKATGGKRADYNAMMDAERNYVQLSDWLYRQGIAATWNREKQEYMVRTLLHTQ